MVIGLEAQQRRFQSMKFKIKDRFKLGRITQCFSKLKCVNVRLKLQEKGIYICMLKIVITSVALFLDLDPGRNNQLLRDAMIDC